MNDQKGGVNQPWRWKKFEDRSSTLEKGFEEVDFSCNLGLEEVDLYVIVPLWACKFKFFNNIKFVSNYAITPRFLECHLVTVSKT